MAHHSSSIIQHCPRILIVDDDPANIAILADILRPECEIFAVKSGADALKWLSSDNTPDLILLDVRMPQMDGYEVCRRLQADPRWEAIPVIFVTSLDDAEKEALGLFLGAVDYITRPFSPAIVKARVKNHLELARTRKSSDQRYQALFSSMADGVAIHDLSGRFLEVNEPFCAKTGYDREELLGMTITDIDCKEDARLHAERFARLIESGYGLFEVRHLRKDGTSFPVEVSVRLFELDGHPAALAVCRDITARKRTEEERDRYRMQLEELVDRRTRELEEKRRTLAELERDLNKRKSFRNIVGKSEAMQTIYSRLEVLADLPSTVLITGESGTGKDLVAEALHHGGVRRGSPLIRIACSDLTENLIESELFGHVRGAFTGALKDRAGRLAQAGRGTLFLDEIGDIPPRFQTRLLRVLEQRTFERVGESRSIPMAARIVAATNRDLAEMVRTGSFREDLYYRLKVIEVHLPPLRERKGDLQLLADSFLEELNRELGKHIEGLSPDAMRVIMEYPWPGNVREFKHAMEHALILCRGAMLEPGDLPLEIREYKSAALPLPADITEDEASTIMQTLRNVKWNKTAAARTLGMSRQTLYRKLKALGVEDSTP